MNPNLPPDGFADEPVNAGPPDGFADEAQKASSAYGAKDYVGGIARPFLEGGAAVAGGILGAPLGPVGAAGGGALGFAAGKAGADLLDRGLGRKPLLRNVGEAAQETGNDLYRGAQAKATGQVVGRVVPSIFRKVGKLVSQAGEWVNGVPARDYETLANNPSAILPGKLKTAGDRFESAMGSAGISNELTPEAVDRMRSPGQYAFDTFNKLKIEGAITPQEALHARQSIDAAYPIPNPKNGSYIRMLDQMRSAFQDVIGNASPELKAASKDYAIAKAGESFQNIFPQTRSGKPSFFRSGLILGGLKAGQPTALLGTPLGAGVATATAGPVGVAGQRLFSNPNSARGITSSIFGKFLPTNPVSKAGKIGRANQVQNDLNGNPEDNNNKESVDESVNHNSPKPVITEKKAREYLKKAKGDKHQARAMALNDGWMLA